MISHFVLSYVAIARPTPTPGGRRFAGLLRSQCFGTSLAAAWEPSLIFGELPDGRQASHDMAPRHTSALFFMFHEV